VLLRPPEAAAAAAAAAVAAAAAGSTGGGGGGSTIAALGARHNMAEHRERLLGHHKAAALDLRKGARSGEPSHAKVARSAAAHLAIQRRRVLLVVGARHA
jgi:galactokinase